jgi:hypothetical protein
MKTSLTKKKLKNSKNNKSIDSINTDNSEYKMDKYSVQKRLK